MYPLLDDNNYPMLIFPANDIQSHPELLEKSDYPTAFFCENDSIAISLIKSLQDIVMRIPEDISIIGFDNISESSIIKTRTYYY